MNGFLAGPIGDPRCWRKSQIWYYDISDSTINWNNECDTTNTTYLIRETKALQEEYKKFKGTEIRERHENAFAGDVSSMLWPGEAYMDGDQGLEENRPLYCLWFLRAAIQNDPKALTYYGTATRWEDSLRSSATLRRECLGRAGSLGFLPAKAKYAWQLGHTNGTLTYPEKSKRMFQEAANGGSALGFYGLMIYSNFRKEKEKVVQHGENCLSASYFQLYNELINSLLRYDTNDETERISNYKAYTYCMRLKDHPDLYHQPKRTEWAMETLYEEKECLTFDSHLRYHLGSFIIGGWGYLGTGRRP
ncbi:hypothetical protein BJ684DRAFT_19206 [Piptocephalis cylindrospora]|uniref:Uncharacterized protein n=1 Tax=Piptocephalis cylindrospora TaxID=1907219 RepID=A0A4P9Y604_9FUNG|nr:hypothetical protein BJ684DRAFT_19206 [Piptocephalis cylindrospora]|eukprot:RKP14385.1 hypothetical protein BJ684DRAFT_19206 [Piptocephalis cylindrospora]